MTRISDRIIDLPGIAALLNVQLNTVRAWGKRGHLPEPAGHVAKSPYWERDTIRAWAERTGRGQNARKRPQEAPGATESPEDEPVTVVAPSPEQSTSSGTVPFTYVTGPLYPVTSLEMMGIEVRQEVAAPEPPPLAAPEPPLVVPSDCKHRVGWNQAGAELHCKGCGARFVGWNPDSTARVAL